jgi:hypothetical protein
LKRRASNNTTDKGIPQIRLKANCFGEHEKGGTAMEQQKLGSQGLIVSQMGSVAWA